MTGQLLPTVVIRDKAVEGGARIINQADLTENDVVLEPKSESKPVRHPHEARAGKGGTDPGKQGSDA